MDWVQEKNKDRNKSWYGFEEKAKELKTFGFTSLNHKMGPVLFFILLVSLLMSCLIVV